MIPSTSFRNSMAYPHLVTAPVGSGDTIHVAVLDQHRSFAEALGLALTGLDGLVCVGIATSCDELVSLAVDHQPEVVLLDYVLPDGTGVDCAAMLSAAGIEARLILVTAHASPDVCARALNAGFDQIIPKEAPLDEIASAIRMPPRTPIHMISFEVAFSKRQREVLELMGQGLGPAAIAEVLYVSVHTARSHVKDVMRLLGVSTQLAAVVKAIREGYLLPPSKNDAPINWPSSPNRDLPEECPPLGVSIAERVQSRTR